MNPFTNHMDDVELSKIRRIGEIAAQMAQEGRRVVKLHVGEPDFDTPEQICRAAAASLQDRDTHYAPNRGTMALREAVARKLAGENGITADPESEILILNGCAEALFCAVTGLLDPGQELIVIEPTFINYIQLAKIANVKPVIVRATQANRWLPDTSDIKRAITPKTGMLLLNTPTNPTGAVYPRELLLEIAALSQQHGFLVASDEVYEKVIFDGAAHVSIGALSGMEDRCVTINGFSKAYAMTGWRLGYVAACAQLTLPMLKMHQYTTTCLPAFVQAGGVEALQSAEADVQEMRKQYQRRRDMLAEWLRECADIDLVLPQGTFYMYPNIKKSGLDSDKFTTRLLQEYGVAAVAGTAFDREGVENIRISFASDEESLRYGAAQIKAMLQVLITLSCC